MFCVELLLQTTLSAFTGGVWGVGGRWETQVVPDLGKKRVQMLDLL